MKRITALARQKRAKDRISVYLDGEFAFGLEAAAATELKVGRALSDDEIFALKQHDCREKGTQLALRFIALRPRSVEEVIRNLLRNGYSETEANEITSHLISVELLDDEAFARYWIDQRESFRPRSHVALQHELREKGVSRAIIDQALLGLDELKSARQAAANKLYRWQKLPEEQFKLKLGRFLLRRGFSYEITNQLTSEMWRTVSADRAADPDATCEGD